LEDWNNGIMEYWRNLIKITDPFCVVFPPAFKHSPASAGNGIRLKIILKMGFSPFSKACLPVGTTVSYILRGEIMP
jgi:hypothetical protein